MRIRIASTGWGTVQDTKGNVQVAKTATLTDLEGDPVTVYSAATGDTTLSSLVTNSRGEIPGYIEPGTYLLSVVNVSGARVEAAPGQIAAQPPLGFGGGGFVRTQTTPVVNRTASSKAFRDPAIYAEDRGTNRHFWLYGALTGDTGPAVSTGDIALSTAVVPIGTEPTDADFEYQGVVISHTVVPPSATGGNQAGFVGPSGVLKIGGTYHTWVVAIANDWLDVVHGSIVHLTATDPAGPWTYHDVATQPETGEATTHDNCCPVYFKGQWVMAVKVFDDALTNFTLRFYTAMSVNGPWTRQAIPTVYGGYNTLTTPPERAGELQGDSPILFVDGGRLYYGLVTLSWFTGVYDVSDDLSTMNYRGSAFQIPNSTGATSSEETGSSQFGAGNWFRIGDEVYYAYHALPRPNASTSYYRAFLAKWSPGAGVYVQLPAANLALDTAISAGATITVNVPTTVPYEATALDITLRVKESTSIGAGNKHATVYSGSTVGDAPVQAFAPTLSAKHIARGRVVLLPGGNPRTLSVTSQNSLAGTIDVGLNGYWRLP